MAKKEKGKLSFGKLRYELAREFVAASGEKESELVEGHDDENDDHRVPRFRVQAEIEGT